ncbi:hypothetical protein [Streptomyces sp. NBC_01304]|uniref:hypothetical protein n=1 Tax=Streptomyces sp. NBC_01304 TaxID=2903818 RepID=UPI002E0FB1F6|nr:DUF3592 domain-containing protein [Streptomyces sp. NBC_01304]
MTRGGVGDRGQELVLRGRRGTARFKGKSLSVDRAGVRLSIPPHAVEAVRAAGRKGADVEIVLTAVKGANPTVHTVRAPNARAATDFAQAVNAALPARDRAARQVDGAALVKTTAIPPRPRKQRAWTPRDEPERWLFGGLFVLGAAVPLARGMWEMALLWTATYAAYGALAAIAVLVCRATKSWWVLRRRGITVTATYDRTEWGYGEDTTSTKVFVFTDGNGNKVDYRGGGRLVGTDPDQIEVTYDPDNPQQASARYGPAARAGLLLVYVTLGIPVTLACIAYPFVYFAMVFHVL